MKPRRRAIRAERARRSASKVRVGKGMILTPPGCRIEGQVPQNLPPKRRIKLNLHLPPKERLQMIQQNLLLQGKKAGSSNRPLRRSTHLTVVGVDQLYRFRCIHRTAGWAESSFNSLGWSVHVTATQNPNYSFIA